MHNYVDQFHFKNPYVGCKTCKGGVLYMRSCTVRGTREHPGLPAKKVAEFD